MIEDVFLDFESRGVVGLQAFRTVPNWPTTGPETFTIRGFVGAATLFSTGSDADSVVADFDRQLTTFQRIQPRKLP